MKDFQPNTNSNGSDAGNDRPAETQTNNAHNSIALTDLQLDDLLARHPDLRREIERARREGHVEGWGEAVQTLFDYTGDGVVIHEIDHNYDVEDWTMSTDQINQFSHLLYAWQDSLDDEPVPPHGGDWELPPTLKDGGLLQWCENNDGEHHHE